MCAQSYLPSPWLGRDGLSAADSGDPLLKPDTREAMHPILLPTPLAFEGLILARRLNSVFKCAEQAIHRGERSTVRLGRVLFRPGDFFSSKSPHVLLSREGEYVPMRVAEAIFPSSVLPPPQVPGHTVPRV